MATENMISLETIIDNLPCAILAVNDKKEILLSNKEAALFAEATQKELLGDQVGNVFKCERSFGSPLGCGHAPACRLCFMRQAIECTIATHEDQSSIEWEVEFRDKGKRFLRISTRYLCEFNSVLVAFEDVTDSKKLEELRLEKEKLKAAIATSGAICHEMNQPLQVISGYIDIFLLTEEDTEHFKEEFKIAKEQIGRLSEITRKLQRLTGYKTKTYINDLQILDLDKASDENNILI